MFDTLVVEPQLALPLHNVQARPSSVSCTYSNTCCRSDVAAADDLSECDEGDCEEKEGRDDAIETDELASPAMLVATVIPCFARRL